MVFLVIVLGALHGIFLLPVLLSILGPAGCGKEDDADTDSGSSGDAEGAKKEKGGGLATAGSSGTSTPRSIIAPEKEGEEERWKKEGLPIQERSCLLGKYLGSYYETYAAR